MATRKPPLTPRTKQTPSERTQLAAFKRRLRRPLTAAERQETIALFDALPTDDQRLLENIVRAFTRTAHRRRPAQKGAL